MIPEHLKRKTFWPLEDLLVLYKPLVVVEWYPYSPEINPVRLANLLRHIVRNGQAAHPLALRRDASLR